MLLMYKQQKKINLNKTYFSYTNSGRKQRQFTGSIGDYLKHK